MHRPLCSVDTSIVYKERVHMKILCGSVFVVAILFLGVSAEAHTTGASFEKPVGKYIVDVGYDPGTFVIGESIRFDFELKEQKDLASVHFAQVWVRILEEGSTVLATGIHRGEYGNPTLLYTFAQPGKYVLEASFRDVADNDIAVQQFPISVSADPNNTSSVTFITPALVFLFGAFVGALAIVIRTHRKA